VPRPPASRTGKRVAVIGSGPAGLAAADQLNQAGYAVVVFERDDRPGGLLRYGIPDFKLEKHVIERRIDIMLREGVEFMTSTEVGVNYPIEELEQFDAVVLCGGATKARDLPIPGRELDGIHFAWDYLWQQNKRVAGDSLEGIDPIRAKDKHVIVIGGGDTGSDCIGTANRQGARSISQFELLPMPPKGRPEHQPWPFYPMKLTVSSSHEEGADRRWSILTKEFTGSNGHVEKLTTVHAVPKTDEEGRTRLEEQRGTTKDWPADLVLLAIGYVGPEKEGMISQLGLELDSRGNVKTNVDYMTSRPGIFSAGDMRRGQSLVVWAISEGREAARGVDTYLRQEATPLPGKGVGDLPIIR
jgi:glutamate synthase (NADPH/NADH) small chain